MEDGGGAPLSPLVPTEDAIKSLIENLVDPLLPMIFGPPEAQRQEAVAKQMHAVVLLYNYYHLKQYPQLEFLNFESFCNVAVTAKPCLSIFMKFMRKYKDISGLSTTEKAIMAACNICTWLDATKDAPNMENWPISKVGIFLVDSVKQKCLLQFGTITQGVWSLVEGVVGNLVGGSQTKRYVSKEVKAESGFLGDQSCAFDDLLHKRAVFIVEQKTGIHQSNLRVLEHHIAYSLSQEKTTTRLYIMTYTGPVNEEFVEIPIEEVLSSLRGSLFTRDRTVEVTPVVEYYHLLPYTKIISDWISRESRCCDPLHVVRPQTTDLGECPLEPAGDLITEDPSINNKSDSNKKIPVFADEEMKESKNEMLHKKLDVPCLSGSVGGHPSITGDSFVKPDRLPDIGVHPMNDNSFSSVQTMDILSDENIMKNTIDHSKGIGGSCTNGSTKVLKASQSSLGDHQKMSNHVENPERKRTVVSEAHIPQRQMISKQVDLNVVLDGFRDEDHAENIERKRTVVSEAHIPQREMISKQAAMVDSVGKPCKENSAGVKPLTDSVEDRAATYDVPLVPSQFTSENDDTFRLATSVKKTHLLESSFLVLHKIRDELCQRRQILEDEIARCEMKIQSIADGGEENLTSNVEFIVESCNDLISSSKQLHTSFPFEQSGSRNIKRRRLYEEAGAEKLVQESNNQQEEGVNTQGKSGEKKGTKTSGEKKRNETLVEEIREFQLTPLANNSSPMMTSSTSPNTSFSSRSLGFLRRHGTMDVSSTLVIAKYVGSDGASR